MPVLTEPQSTAPTRELAAIMFSDIAGYTAIMGRDERFSSRLQTGVTEAKAL
jgi:class 3 adenylate cyclase